MVDPLDHLLDQLRVIAYFQQLRVTRWIGDLGMWLEHEFFGLASPTAKLKDRYGHTAVGGLRVEEVAGRIAEQLLPLLDRSNRVLLRNLKALRAMRERPAPTLSIGSAGQVNVGTTQFTAAQFTAVGSPPPAAGHPRQRPASGPELNPKVRLKEASSVADRQERAARGHPRGLGPAPSEAFRQPD